MAEELEITENIKVLADKGYWRIDDIVKCHHDERIEVIVAIPKEQGVSGYRKSDFKYNASEFFCFSAFFKQFNIRTLTSNFSGRCSLNTMTITVISAVTSAAYE